MTRLMSLDVSFIEAHIKAMSTSRCSIARKAIRAANKTPHPPCPHRPPARPRVRAAGSRGAGARRAQGLLSSAFAASRRGSGFLDNGPGPLDLDSPVPATPGGSCQEPHAKSLMGPPLPLPEHSAQFELRTKPLAPVEPADVGVALAPGSAPRAAPPAPGSAGAEARAELVRHLTAIGFSAEVRACLRPPAARAAARS